MQRYFAFISYKRGGVDQRVANWIHSKLEKYPYPAELVERENRPDHETLIRSIFLDTKDLPVTDNSFTDEIREAIKNSRYLILVGSKLSAQSVYVNMEVSYFLETHDGDTSRILPVFIDSVEDGLPEVLRSSDLLSRHCPIYSSAEDAKNEINLYCFYHIVAFLLKVDFKIIYDRYKAYAKRKSRQVRWVRNAFYALTLCALAFLGYSWHSQREVIRRQAYIVELEKRIFPYSVVTGYVKNFLKPVVEYIKANEPEAHIWVHMPTNAHDLDNDHRDRFEQISHHIVNELSLDSISKVHLKTSMPRGSTVHKLYSSRNEELNHKYLDFASTTSTFLAIAKKKREYPIYKDVTIDFMIAEYTDIFIEQVNQELGEDAKYVTFVTRIGDILTTVKE